MDERLYQTLKWIAIALGAMWIGWSIWDGLLREERPGDQEYMAGNRLFEDGYYERALAEYDKALENAPGTVYTIRARARTLMQLGRNEEALQAFDEAIALEPAFAGTYANRGILYDRMGEYEKALADYRRALELDAETVEGPHWLIRFLRNQPEPPPTVADRASYLEEQLALPESDRLLRVPEIDEKQRSYKK